eukprot:5090674-Alexandrium_andersonii.AAC.1
MSASLVGSEMCIRDSGGGTPLPKLCPRAPHHWSQTRAVRRRPPSMTVSYTHLTLPTICSV